MINPSKDIVFDLGGVVLEWNPEAIIAASFSDPEERHIARRDIFDHPDWGDLDRGLLPPEQLIDRAAERTPLSRSSIAAMFERVLPSLVLIPETVRIMHRLKDHGHRLFCLSNMYPELIDHLEASFDFWHLFTTCTISCRVQAIKPDREIYLKLIEDNNLVPSRTLFFDDLPHNIQAARNLGIQAHCFTGPADCEAILSKLGYFH